MSNTVVQTNVLALNAHRNIGIVANRQARGSQRLSSGFRINSAADDAAGLAISEKMRSQIRGLDQASRNAQDGISLIQTAEGAMQTINEMVTRVRELVIQASNDTNAHDAANLAQSDRIQIQREINQLLDEIDATTERTQFNTRQLIDGSLAVNGIWEGGTAAITGRHVRFEAGAPISRADAETQFTNWMVANHNISAVNAADLTEHLMGLMNGANHMFVPGSQMNPAHLTDGVLNSIFGAGADQANLGVFTGWTAENAAFTNAWFDAGFSAPGASNSDMRDAFATRLNSAPVRAAFADRDHVFTEAELLALVDADADFMLGNNISAPGSGFTTTELADFLNANFSDIRTVLHGGILGHMSDAEVFNFIGGVADATAVRAGTDSGLLTANALLAAREVISGLWNANANLGFVPATIEADRTSNATMPVGVRLNSTQMQGLAGFLNSRTITQLENDFTDATDPRLAALHQGAGGTGGAGTFADATALLAWMNDNREGWLEIREGQAADPGTYVPSGGSALWFHIGANMDQGVNLSIENVSVAALSNVPRTFGQELENGAFTFAALRNDNLAHDSGIMMTSGEDINKFVQSIDLALAHTTAQRAHLGAMQNRLEFTMQNLDISSENLSAAESRIRDADMALEMMRFTQANVLQQAAMSMLAQANQAPMSVLQLLN